MTQFVQVDVAAEEVQIDSYSYAFGRGPDPTSEQAWIFRYEYEDQVQPDYPYSPAHIHINAPELADRISAKPVKKLHFPTGRISFEQVLVHLIQECGIPVLGRNDEDRRRQVLDRLWESHGALMARHTDFHHPND